MAKKKKTDENRSLTIHVRMNLEEIERIKRFAVYAESVTSALRRLAMEKVMQLEKEAEE